jgi:putative transposase
LRRPLESAQYTSIAFGNRCEALGVRPSMGSVGDAYDNAMAESLFATIECELLDRQRFQTQVEGRMAVFEWIEAWYNPRRRHSAIGYLPPVEFERRHAEGTQGGGFAPVSLNGEIKIQTLNENSLREVPESA